MKQVVPNLNDLVEDRKKNNLFNSNPNPNEGDGYLRGNSLLTLKRMRDLPSELSSLNNKITYRDEDNVDKYKENQKRRRINELPGNFFNLKKRLCAHSREHEDTRKL